MCCGMLPLHCTAYGAGSVARCGAVRLRLRTVLERVLEGVDAEPVAHAAVLDVEHVAEADRPAQLLLPAVQLRLQELRVTCTRRAGGAGQLRGRTASTPHTSPPPNPADMPPPMQWCPMA